MTSLRARTLSLSLVTGLLVSLALVLVPTAPASAAAQGITGQVTGPGGVPLPGIEVDFLQEIYPDVWAPVESAVTDSSGNYAAALSARTWRVGFADYDNGAYLSEFYDDVASIDDASDVLVSDGDVVENVDAELSVASHITGSISGSDAPTVPYADVYGYVLDGGEWVPTSWAGADANGDYDLSVAQGTYRLEFDADGYVGEFFDDVATVEEATSIPVGADETVSGKDAELEKGAALSGEVTLPAGADPDDSDGTVEVFDATGHLVGATWLFSGDETAPGSRTYPWWVGGLPAGDYRVEFGGELDPTNRHATSEAEFYDDSPESGGIAGADTLTVTGGEDRTGIDATLRVGGTISGSVVDGDGEPLVNCAVHAVNNSGISTRLGITDAEGDFAVSGLTTADYALVVGAGAVGTACNQAEYYTNTNGDLSNVPVGLVTVPAAPGSDTPIDATLVYQGSVAPAPSVTNTAPPSVPAAAVIGTPVVASPGTWDPSDVTLSYQWRINGGNIPGETSSAYTPQPGMQGLRLSVVVTASKPGFTSKSVLSNETAPITGPSPASSTVANFALPSVAGTPRVGMQLSANPGTWTDGATTTVRWLRDGREIVGATGSTYTLGADDLGAHMSVWVTADKTGYTSASRFSAATGQVQAGIFTLIDASRILGKLKVGKVLRAVPPTTAPAATSVRYRWLRNGVRIKGAAAKQAAYRLVKADRGKHITVKVTVLRDGYAKTKSVAKRAGTVR